MAILSKDARYRSVAVPMIEAQLTSWVRENPPFLGIHYVSAMECALRLIAVCYALDIVRPWLREPAATWAAAARLVESHARLIYQRPSLYSSATNHTVAEACGLIFAGALFPEMSGASGWHSQGSRLLREQITSNLAARRRRRASAGVPQTGRGTCHVGHATNARHRCTRHAAPIEQSATLSGRSRRRGRQIAGVG
ncbi:MAG: hypothetical protein HC809_14695 [Gammaproteobacteria bacterium]|nr:hypothetical protein [Gammaproteobacteria bacterium]